MFVKEKVLGDVLTAIGHNSPGRVVEVGEELVAMILSLGGVIKRAERPQKATGDFLLEVSFAKLRFVHRSHLEFSLADYHRRRLKTLGVTAREWEIATGISEGLGLKDIAARLNLGIKTVDSHRTNLYRKLGMHNQVDITRWVLANR